MKRDPSLTLTPVIAAALRRRPRARAGEGVETQNLKNNYVAEGRVTRRFRLKKRKKAGARPGNLNAVQFPLKTPEDIALYRRIAAVTKTAKFLVRAVNRDLRARRQETEYP
ncbi:MAG: hypothetical protein ISS15_17265 [Alphaproteobacteria bacterium]|nr:hypothetical protein [Alphaproteobacteria bacterium]MBL6937762.1 hypothetical protein [Alphaproteobacteria bacterium]MBL7099412.1 hypothetical protein [Alphaproteobacteria bacterium]